MTKDATVSSPFYIRKTFLGILVIPRIDIFEELQFNSQLFFNFVCHSSKEDINRNNDLSLTYVLSHVSNGDNLPIIIFILI